MTKICVPLVLTMALALAACSEKPVNDNAEPDIALSAAPGVAFTYDYRFALAARAIAPMQEKHAAACEALGMQRCRITGLSFRRTGADSVDATLALALEPGLARRFGRDASAQVEAERGMVRAVEIGAQDVSRQIQQGDARVQAVQDDRARLRAASADIKGQSGRTDIERQIGETRAQEREALVQADDARAAPAWTSMRFDYATDGFVPTFRRTMIRTLAHASYVLEWLLATLIALAILALSTALTVLIGSYTLSGAEIFGRWLAAKQLPVASAA